MGNQHELIDNNTSLGRPGIRPDAGVEVGHHSLGMGAVTNGKSDNRCKARLAGCWLAVGVSASEKLVSAAAAFGAVAAALVMVHPAAHYRCTLLMLRSLCGRARGQLVKAGRCPKTFISSFVWGLDMLYSSKFN